MNEVGLHARPAAQFVQHAAKFKADIQIRKLEDEAKWVNAKSILSVLTLGAGKGQQIEIQISGEDEAEAAENLCQLIESDFAA
ncbi:MAG: HPr family phosphocarrier protein [Anaerolineales bacterium]|nr:HPr family phosphocarrier protein [Anaerolineales bacterium]